MPVSGTMVSAAAPRPADIASAPPARPHPARSAPPRDRSPAVRLRGLGEPHLRPTRGIAEPGRAVAAGATHGGAVGRHRHCPTSPHGSAAWCCRAARRCAGALAQGNSAIAIARLRQLDHRLASAPDGAAEIAIALRARAHILGLSEALTAHCPYFDSGTPA